MEPSKLAAVPRTTAPSVFDDPQVKEQLALRDHQIAVMSQQIGNLAAQVALADAMNANLLKQLQALQSPPKE